MATTRASDAVTLERARSLAIEAMWAIALQRCRLLSAESGGAEFIFRWWVDLQFFIVALRRLRRAGELATHADSVAESMAAAIKTFDDRLPQLSRMRNVGEQIDAYAVGSPGRRDKTISRGIIRS